MAISVVQEVSSAAPAGSVSSLGVTISPTAHNELIAGVIARNGVTGVTGPGGTWQKAVEKILSSFAVSIWYLEDVASGSQSPSWSQAATDGMEIRCFEVSGLATSSSLDQTASNSSTTATNPIDTGTTAATSIANEFAFAVFGSSGSGNRTPSGITNGYTLDTGSPLDDNTATHPVHLSIGYKILSAIGTQNSEITLSTAQIWNAVIATFKASSSTPINLSVTFLPLGSPAPQPIAQKIMRASIGPLATPYMSMQASKVLSATVPPLASMSPNLVVPNAQVVTPLLRFPHARFGSQR